MVSKDERSLPIESDALISAAEASATYQKPLLMLMEQGFWCDYWSHRNCYSNWNYNYVTCGGCQRLIFGSLAIILATTAYAFAGVWGKMKLAEYSPTQSAVGMVI